MSSVSARNIIIVFAMNKSYPIINSVKYPAETTIKYSTNFQAVLNTLADFISSPVFLAAIIHVMKSKIISIKIADRRGLEISPKWN